MKKRHMIVLVAAFLSAFLYTAAVFADDIAKEGEIDSIFTDHRAYKVGDIVTILVVESVEGSQQASLSTSKSQQLQGSLGMSKSQWSNGSIISFPSAFGAAGGESQNGGGTSTRKGSLIAKISARVEKVLANGNLVIKGTKIIQVNDEKQNLLIKGVIRAEDISSDNTIPSTNVADAMIEFEGNGPIGEKTSPGIITRILDWLGIF